MSKSHSKSKSSHRESSAIDNLTDDQFAALYIRIANEIAPGLARRNFVSPDDLLEPVLGEYPRILAATRKARPESVNGYVATCLTREMEKTARSIRKRYAKELPLSQARSAVTMPDTTLETWEEIMACCNSPQDKEIVTMKRDGHSPMEIARTLGIPTSTVYLRLKQIEARFDARQRSYLDSNAGTSRKSNDFRAEKVLSEPSARLAKAERPAGHLPELALAV